jgi:predicted nucleic acid-binding protein
VIVADASIAAAWYLEPDNIAARAAFVEILERGVAVPGNFLAEIAQALLRSVRLSRIKNDEMRVAIEGLSTLEIVVEPTSLSSLIALATRHLLSSYDAGYLYVATSRGAQLATLDAQLARAARAEGCLWTPPPGGPTATEKRFSLLLAV